MTFIPQNSIFFLKSSISKLSDSYFNKPLGLKEICTAKLISFKTINTCWQLWLILDILDSKALPTNLVVNFSMSVTQRDDSNVPLSCHFLLFQFVVLFRLDWVVEELDQACLGENLKLCCCDVLWGLFRRSICKAELSFLWECRNFVLSCLVAAVLTQKQIQHNDQFGLWPCYPGFNYSTGVNLFVGSMSRILVELVKMGHVRRRWMETRPIQLPKYLIVPNPCRRNGIQLWK